MLFRNAHLRKNAVQIPTPGFIYLFALYLDFICSMNKLKCKMKKNVLKII